MKDNNDHSSLGNPFDHRQSLIHGRHCDCHNCQPTTKSIITQTQAGPSSAPADSDAVMDRMVESALVRGMFGHSDMHRRQFMKLVGGGTVAAALASLLPMDAIKAAVKEDLGPLEKTELDIGFIPITCATPIIMAHPMGFYERYGLNVNVIKTAGWALIRDNSLNDRFDAAHMLSPMPLAMSLGAGSSQRSFITPAIENINGQAIVLHNDHQDKRDPQQWKGFTFGVPFEYSMHNFLLRYYVAEHGLDPDQDIQIRVIPPPEMVANLRAGNIDGFLSPDPFNQRAVFERIGFIHVLTKDIWDGHPCCAFATSATFARENPNTYGALLRSIIDATQYSSDPANRSEIAEAIAPTNYLNQPVTVIEQVLTGRYADGLGEVQNVPNRIDFDPFPWHSMAVWILTQMKRWGYIEGHVDYQQVARDVFLATEARDVMRELGYDAPEETSRNYEIMGKTFDYSQPDAYLESFAIGRS